MFIPDSIVRQYKIIGRPIMVGNMFVCLFVCWEFVGACESLRVDWSVPGSLILMRRSTFVEKSLVATNGKPPGKALQNDR